MSGDYHEPIPPWFPTYEGRPVRRLTLDKRTADFQDFFKWVQDSNSSIYRQITSDSNNYGRMLEQLLSILIRELDSKQIAKRRTALQLIDQIVTNRYGHEPFSTVVQSSLQNQVLNAVVLSLRDSNPTVRSLAIATLGGVTDWSEPELVKALVQHGVNNSDADIALFAIELLGRAEINLRSIAVSSLTSSLGHVDDGVRQAACKALGDLGADSLSAATELFRVAESDDSGNVRFAALDSLLKIYIDDQIVIQHFLGIPNLQPFIDFLRTGGDRIRKLRHGLQTQQPADTEIPLASTEVAILTALYKKYPQLVSQYNFEGRSRGTVGPALTKLRNAGYTHRPKGQRKGETLTQKGFVVAKRLAEIEQ
jgi:HEAT repeats